MFVFAIAIAQGKWVTPKLPDIKYGDKLFGDANSFQAKWIKCGVRSEKSRERRRFVS